MTTSPGGYCPMCNTVYDKPHECVVDVVSNRFYKCEGCGETLNVWEGHFCAKDFPNSVGKPLETKMDTSNKNLGDTKKGYAVVRDSVYVKEIWNEAIEAAALIVQPNPHIDEERECQNVAAQIRKLKK